MRHRFLISIGLSSFLATLIPQAAAEVALSEVFGDHMVMQRDVPLPIWGRAASREQVRVSFGDATATTVANEDGRWQVVLPSQPASVEPASTQDRLRAVGIAAVSAEQVRPLDCDLANFSIGNGLPAVVDQCDGAIDWFADRSHRACATRLGPRCNAAGDRFGQAV